MILPTGGRSARASARSAFRDGPGAGLTVSLRTRSNGLLEPLQRVQLMIGVTGSAGVPALGVHMGCTCIRSVMPRSPRSVSKRSDLPAEERVAAGRVVSCLSTVGGATVSGSRHYWVDPKSPRVIDLTPQTGPETIGKKLRG